MCSPRSAPTIRGISVSRQDPGEVVGRGVQGAVDNRVEELGAAAAPCAGQVGPAGRAGPLIVAPRPVSGARPTPCLPATATSLPVSRPRWWPCCARASGHRCGHGLVVAVLCQLLLGAHLPPRRGGGGGCGGTAPRRRSCPAADAGVVGAGLAPGRHPHLAWAARRRGPSPPGGSEGLGQPAGE
jgi:hypothetical protein